MIENDRHMLQFKEETCVTFAGKLSNDQGFEELTKRLLYADEIH